MVTGKLVAAGEQAGIRLEVPNTAHPGDAITVKVIPVVPMNFADLTVFVDSDGAELDETSSHLPHEFSFTIRKEAIGLVKFSALAFDVHNLTYTAEADVRVVTDATLTSFELFPLVGGEGFKALEEEQRHRQQITLVVGQEQGFTIIGTYSDRVERNLESPRTGTAYKIENPQVVRVTDRGTLEGVGEGTTEVVASQGNFSVTLDVRVVTNEAELVDNPMPTPAPPEAQPTKRGQGGVELVIGDRQK